MRAPAVSFGTVLIRPFGFLYLPSLQEQKDEEARDSFVTDASTSSSTAPKSGKSEGNGSSGKQNAKKGRGKRDKVN